MTKINHSAWESQFVPIAFEAQIPVSIYPHADTDAPVDVLHTHDCIELSICTEGCGVFYMANTLRSYGAGDCFLIPQGCRHRSQSAPNTTAVWKTLYLDWNALQSLGPSSGYSWKLLPIMHLGREEADTLVQSVDAILHEYSSRATQWKMALGGHLLVLQAALQRLRKRSHLESELLENPDVERLSPALQYIAEHLSESLSVTRLAQLCHLSEPHFRRLFSNLMGQGPKQFITRTRIELAQTMLTEPSRTVLDIAYACGYDSISAFNRAFRMITGDSPLHWRQRYRSQG